MPKTVILLALASPFITDMLSVALLNARPKDDINSSFVNSVPQDCVVFITFEPG